MQQRMHLKELEKKMIQQAIRRHRKIFPCGNRERLDDCFTRDEDDMLFWFNTEDHSTHVITAGVAG